MQEKDAAGGSVRQLTLIGLKMAFARQSKIAIVSKATFGKLLKDRIEHINRINKKKKKGGAVGGGGGALPRTLDMPPSTGLPDSTVVTAEIGYKEGWALSHPVSTGQWLRLPNLGSRWVNILPFASACNPAS